MAVMQLKLIGYLINLIVLPLLFNKEKRKQEKTALVDQFRNVPVTKM